MMPRGTRLFVKLMADLQKDRHVGIIVYKSRDESKGQGYESGIENQTNPLSVAHGFGDSFLV